MAVARMTAQQAADLVHVSRRTLFYARKVARLATDETIAYVEEGALPVSAVAKALDHYPAEDVEVACAALVGRKRGARKITVLAACDRLAAAGIIPRWRPTSTDGAGHGHSSEGDERDGLAEGDEREHVAGDGT